jgi:SPX domain protein involved in polyphosphate accumulation
MLFQDKFKEAPCKKSFISKLIYENLYIKYFESQFLDYSQLKETINKRNSQSQLLESSNQQEIKDLQILVEKSKANEQVICLAKL